MGEKPDTGRGRPAVHFEECPCGSARRHGYAYKVRKGFIIGPKRLIRLTGIDIALRDLDALATEWKLAESTKENLAHEIYAAINGSQPVLALEDIFPGLAAEESAEEQGLVLDPVDIPAA